MKFKLVEDLDNVTAVIKSKDPEIQIATEIPVTMADAVQTSEERKKQIEEVSKDTMKLVDEFIKRNHQRELKIEDVKDVELTEALDDSTIDATEEGPSTGEDTGIASLLIDAINDEWTTIDKYNAIIATLRDVGHDEFIPVINDIVVEENLHVGQLQTLLNQISPNVANIAEGEAEAAEQLEQ